MGFVNWEVFLISFSMSHKSGGVHFARWSLRLPNCLVAAGGFKYSNTGNYLYQYQCRDFRELTASRAEAYGDSLSMAVKRRAGGWEAVK